MKTAITQIIKHKINPIMDAVKNKNWDIRIKSRNVIIETMNISQFWSSHRDCSLCNEFRESVFTSCNKYCPAKDGALYCCNAFWYRNIKEKINQRDLTVYFDLFDVKMCLESLLVKK